MPGSPHQVLACLLYVMLTGHSFTAWSQSGKYISSSLNCENYLYINGESNVNQFSFRYNKANLPGKFNSPSQDTGNIIISIPIKDFKPSNPMMYGDFLVLMKESEYPKIYVSFPKRHLQGATADDLPGSCPDIRITISGISRTYKIQCSVDKCADYLFLRGEETIKLSDFHLKSPEKLMGLVKVKNEITVNFGFMITFVSSSQISATF